jgi:hypothetical protein
MMNMETNKAGRGMKTGGQLSDLNRAFREDFNEQLTLKQRLEGDKSQRVDILGKNFPVKGNS